MQNLSKRVWGQNLNIKESADIMIDWCIRAREKNVLQKKPPKIYFSYVLEKNIPLNFMQNVSSLFKYSQKDLPYVDEIRDKVLRLLSVALKCHYFLYQDSLVEHEPYFFIQPTLSNESATQVGLVYKLKNETILVCENNLKDLYKDADFLYEFPAVVIEDSFKWYHMKNWHKLKYADNGRLNNHFKPNEYPVYYKAAQMSKTLEELAQYANILNIPYGIKDLVKPLGIEWSKNLNTWYLPKGFDIDSINEYVNYLMHTFHVQSQKKD